MLSPAWIQSSFGKKASAWLARSGVSAPAIVPLFWREALAVPTPAITIAATANDSRGCEIFVEILVIFSPLLLCSFAGTNLKRENGKTVIEPVILELFE
jgi:hypothetical protein